MSMMFYNATLLTPTVQIKRGVVSVSEDGQIIYAGPEDNAPCLEGQIIDLCGLIVIPGLIDIHVHGGNGVTFGDPDASRTLDGYSRWVVVGGVTGFLCSLIAPDPGALVALIQDYVSALEKGLPGAEGLGLHLEGPFLNPEKKGAFNPAWLRQPDLPEAQAFLQAGRGWIRHVTLAPELPGAMQVAALFRLAGVAVALGHSNANYELASAAMNADFTHVTHTFNAQRGFDHRQPGVFGAVLASDRVTAELIADRVHVHPAAMKTLLRCLGTSRVILITDAMSGAGLPDGLYELLGHQITVKDGLATLADGTLAGSTALLNQCVRNIHRDVGLSLGSAVKMASLNPARFLHLQHRLGKLAPGKDASLAVIDQDAQVFLTMVRGKIVFDRLGTGEMQ